MVETVLRFHLRHMRRIYPYLFSKSANSIVKILINCSFWKDDFENRFLTNYSKCNNKSTGN